MTALAPDPTTTERARAATGSRGSTARAKRPSTAAAASQVASLQSVIDALRVENAELQAAAQEARLNNIAITNVQKALVSVRSIDGAARAALDSVRETYGWAYGSYWTVDPVERVLRFTLESGDAGSDFRAVTLAASYREGVGLSGRAWQTQDLVFVRDIGEMADCVRAPVAQRAGLRSAVCFPVVFDGEVVATMDFFAAESLDLSTHRLEALRSVGRMFSRITERATKEVSSREGAEQLRNRVDVLLDVVNSAVAGDLTKQLPFGRREGDDKASDAMIRLAAGVSSLLQTLRQSMTDLGRTAESLGSAAEQLTGVSEDMGRAASQTSDRAASASSSSVEVSASIQTVAIAAEEMTASIGEIAKNAASAAGVATTAVRAASDAKGTVASLGESSAEIGKVIKVITSIAQQTNLLALNATIEAARAGDAGKGFAVVANEVKELAKETARATEDIGQKIEAIQSDTRGAVEAIAEIGGIIDMINDISTTIASAVEEQTATTNEIARNVTEAASGANGIAADIADVAAAADSAQRGAEDSLNSATSLADMAAELTRLVGRFRY